MKSIIRLATSFAALVTVSAAFAEPKLGETNSVLINTQPPCTQLERSVGVASDECGRFSIEELTIMKTQSD